MDTLELRLSIGKQMMIAHLILQYIPATALGVAGIAFQCNPVLQMGLRLIKASHASAVLHSGAAILFEIRAIAHWARAPRNAKEIATRSSSVLLVTAAASLPVFDNVDNLVHVATLVVVLERRCCSSDHSSNGHQKEKRRILGAGQRWQRS